MGVLLDNGEVALDGVQSGVGELIGLLHVWLGVAVRGLEVCLDRPAEAAVDAIGELNGLLAVGVRLERLDAVVDGRVGGQVRDELRAWLLAVGQGLGCVRHLDVWWW